MSPLALTVISMLLKCSIKNRSIPLKGMSKVLLFSLSLLNVFVGSVARVAQTERGFDNWHATKARHRRCWFLRRPRLLGCLVGAGVIKEMFSEWVIWFWDQVTPAVNFDNFDSLTLVFRFVCALSCDSGWQLPLLEIYVFQPEGIALQMSRRFKFKNLSLYSTVFV